MIFLGKQCIPQDQAVFGLRASFCVQFLEPCRRNESSPPSNHMSVFIISKGNDGRR